METLNMNLRIIGRNDFGDSIYEQTDKLLNTISLTELDSNKIWSIKNPINIHDSELGENRKYGDDIYFLSKKALSVIPKYGEWGGSICILTFVKNYNTYVIVVGDNKSYITNCGGGKNEGETFETCAIREVKEELNVHIKQAQLIPYAEWNNIHRNALIGAYSWVMKTVCYIVNIEYDTIKHLISDENKFGSVNIYDVKNYDFSLDELNYVVIIDKTKLETFSGIECIEFNGHHKKILLDAFHIKNNIDISYLKSFKYY